MIGAAFCRQPFLLGGTCTPMAWWFPGSWSVGTRPEAAASLGNYRSRPRTVRGGPSPFRGVSEGSVASWPCLCLPALHPGRLPPPGILSPFPLLSALEMPSGRDFLKSCHGRFQTRGRWRAPSRRESTVPLARDVPRGAFWGIPENFSLSGCGSLLLWQVLSVPGRPLLPRP